MGPQLQLDSLVEANGRLLAALNTQVHFAMGQLQLDSLVEENELVY